MTPTAQLETAIAASPSTTSPAAKLASLRALLEQHGLDAYFVPSADEHLNEYLPAARQRRAWLTQFSGSAGDLLVGRQQCWLFVDSRYYEQADLEVDGTLFQVVKLGLDGHKTLTETLAALGDAAIAQQQTLRLGVDPFTITVSQWRKFHDELQLAGVELVPVAGNLVDQVRSQQPWVEVEPIPAIANSALISLPVAITGETVEQKLARVRENLRENRADLLPITKLDQIAWLFNLRGQDIPYNPVFLAYAIVTAEAAYLFTNLERVDATVRSALPATVTLCPYADYPTRLQALLHRQGEPAKPRVLLDVSRTTVGTYHLLTGAVGTLPSDAVRLVETDSPVEVLKAQKQTVELEQMRLANLKASRAKTLTLKWLEAAIAQQIPVTEADVAQTIERLYAEVDGFQGLSFNTIAGAGTNSSIVHYGTPDPNRVLQPGEFLLLDSGAQYWGGTTDDTRTVIIGDPTPEQRDRYTAVLKAHINCAMQQFPKGTTGHQMDGVTRWTLWQAGLDYGHGTGHGVGAFLNVHEGPNGISKRANAALEPGMITSIEPGYYQPGWGGIRIENLYEVVQRSPQPDSAESTPSESTPTTPDNGNPKQWYGFDSLTYIPFDNRLIDFSQLEARQLAWLQAYYAAIVERLTPWLTAEETAWLHTQCTIRLADSQA